MQDEYSHLLSRIEALENDKEFAKDLARLRSQEVALDRNEYQAITDELTNLRKANSSQSERMDGLEKRLAEEKQARRALEKYQNETNSQLHRIKELIETQYQQIHRVEQELKHQISRITDTLLDLGKRTGQLVDNVNDARSNTGNVADTANRALTMARQQKLRLENMNDPMPIDERLAEVERQIRSLSQTTRQKSGQTSDKTSSQPGSPSDTQRLLQDLSASLTSPMKTTTSKLHRSNGTSGYFV